MSESAQPVPLEFRLWSPEECARQLRMSEGTLRNLGKRGPAKVKLGGRVWYRPEAVETWLKSRER